MAVGTHEQEKRYMSIKDGAIIEKVPHSTEVRRYGFISGYLVDITFRESEKYGKSIELHLKDGRDKYVLQMFWNSYLANNFCMALPNIDLTEVVEIEAVIKSNNGRARTEIFVKQDKTALKWFWKKEDMKDLPKISKREVFDPQTNAMKEVPDNSERMAYLENYINQSVLPMIKRIQANDHGDKPIDQEPADEVSTVIDDLPF